MRTLSAKESDIDRKWYVVDATDQPVGRLASRVANTSEIGAVVVTKIEKKSATTRRVVLGFAT